MNHKLIISLDKLAPEESVWIIRNISHKLPEYTNNIVYKFNDLIAFIGFVGIYELLKDIDCRIMLDGKYNDIPNTIRNYITQLHHSGLSDKIDILTLHANGGQAMIREAVKTRDELWWNFEIFAISALTTLEDSDTQEIYDDTSKHSVLKLTWLALHSGVDGMVCSGQETEMLREVFSENDFKILNPWVRFAWGETHDQKRVVTPKKSVENGANYIVMGRPILQADDMISTIQRFFQETHEVTYIPKNRYSFEKLLYTWTWKEILSYIWAFYFRPEWWKYVRFTSKVISNAYINIGAIERNYAVIERATSELAKQIRQKNIDADVVVGAQMWSVRISLSLAKKLWIEQSIYTEKTENDNNNMSLKRHNINLTGLKIIISEDIVSRGTTTAKMREVLEDLGWNVVAIACVGNRFEQESQDGVPIISCFVPPKFELYYDGNTPENQRKDFPKIPDTAIVVEKPKNEWEELVESMK